jgi:hypothetical protein
MFLKVHRSADGCEVVAVCDRELLNTTLRQGDLMIAISEKFYGTLRADEGEVRDALRKATNANLIGPRAVALAIGMGLVSREACIEIAGVPHAIVFVI